MCNRWNRDPSMKENAPSTDPPGEERLDFDCGDFEAAAARVQARYVLRLYITGTTPHATRAIVNIRKICEEHLQGRYQLEIVDIAQHPALAEGEQIIAAPTLIKKLPLPLRRFIGDMSQTEKILLGLDLREKGTKPE
jgi:circadian clock protein KaiB